MRYRKLAKTNIEVSVVCFGCWGIIGGFNWGPQDERDSLAALNTAYESGINFYDTAEGYGSGQSEQLLARGLGHVRQKIVIATKVSPNHFAPVDLRAACEGSLHSLNTDYIDLYQLHWPNHDLPLAETIGVLDALKAEGKIRAYGVSNFAVRDLTSAAMASNAISTNQLAYSLLFRALEYEILPLCMQKNISVLTYSSLMQGLLSGKYTTADDVQPDRARTRHFARTRPFARHLDDGAEVETFAAIADVRSIASELNQPLADISLAWLMAQPGVTSVIAGARNASQTQGVARAAELDLPVEAVTRLSQATEALKTKLGTNPDMWQSVSRMQ